MERMRLRRPRWRNVLAALPLLPWLALLGWLASVTWFISDDAFISFRYVRNLLEGHGLVFNPGEYVEGYTNFLWVLELAAIWGLLGIRPEHAAQWLSVMYTAGTLAVMLWWVARLPLLRQRWLVAWMALGLVCSSATFAVWTSGGGLETRQFTFFTLTAVAVLSVFGANRRGLAAVSLSLAAGALTRPEGLLLAACCVGWFVAQGWVTAQRLDWRGTLTLAGPFAVVIGGHFLARYRYYGEWLPNTYYAKHVDSWYESGYRYLSAAAIETGLYLLLPLAYLALRARWREGRDGTYALILLLLGTHMFYLFEIGGDHFEFRPLDFYWPLLAVPAAEGLARLGAGLSVKLHSLSERLRWVGTWTLAVLLFVPCVFYASAMQGALLFEGLTMHRPGRVFQRFIELNDQTAGWLLAAPATAPLVAISNSLRSQYESQIVGERVHVHRDFADRRIQRWKLYDTVNGPKLPSDAVDARAAIGIPSYFVPDLALVDTLGLTNAAIARNSVQPGSSQRRMAHDRDPPPGYLQGRGVNVRVHPPVASESEALRTSNYTFNIAPNVWMHFDAKDHQWVNKRFAGLDLRAVNRFSQTRPADNRIIANGVVYVGEQFLGRFENGSLDGWEVKGKGVSNHEVNPYLGTVHWLAFGHVGPGYLTTYYPGKWERQGSALSPRFTGSANQSLMFLIAGEASEHVGVRLLADGSQIAVWRGESLKSFDLVLYELSIVAGKQLQLEVFNNEIGDRPRLMLDHVMLVRREAPSAQ